jgi:phospholipid/cholesterol/gamma-HCH transport system substrate-binding protein
MKISNAAKMGAFMILGFLVFATGLFFIGDRHKVFSHHYVLYADFGKLSGLQKGAAVRVAGLTAGQVTDIALLPRPANAYRIRLRLQKKFQSIVRSDSTASIHTEGLVGDQFVDISRGSQNAPDLPAKGILRTEEPVDWTALVQRGLDLMQTTGEAVNDVRANADKALQAVGGAATDARGMITSARGLIASARGDLNGITVSSQRAMDNLNDVIAGIQNGRGAAGKLLRDEDFAKSLDQAVTNARDGSAHLNDASVRLDQMVTDAQTRDLLGRAQAAIENTRQLTDQLNQAVKSFLARSQLAEGTADQLRESIGSANRSMENLADATEALKHNFLVRSFFKKRGFYNLNQMTPAQYRESRFLTSKARVRRWLSANALFVKQKDGIETLSPSAHSHIDEAFAEFVPFMPNSPIVIEGYAIRGATAERFAIARRRATLVSQYIARRFGVDSNLIGTMPLAAPPASAGKSAWDGVSLVLLPE